MIAPLLWLMPALSIATCDHYGPELLGSEGYPLEPQEKVFPFHKPLFAHYISPLIFNPWSHKIAAISHIKQLKPTVTKTKTLVVQTVRKEKKHLVCYKAPYGLPPCSPESKEDSFILPTKVPELPSQGNTQILGYLEGAEIRQVKDSYDDQDQLNRDQRHLFGFRSTKYVTETILITKVEDYIDTHVTATLIASNCVPCNSDLPRCPEKVEHYVHYETGHNTKPIIEKEKKSELIDIRTEKARENSKEFILENRSESENNLYTDTKEVDVTNHKVEKKITQ